MENANRSEGMSTKEMMQGLNVGAGLSTECEWIRTYSWRKQLKEKIRSYKLILLRNQTWQVSKTCQVLVLKLDFHWAHEITRCAHTNHAASICAAVIGFIQQVVSV